MKNIVLILIIIFMNANIAYSYTNGQLELFKQISKDNCIKSYDRVGNPIYDTQCTQKVFMELIKTGNNKNNIIKNKKY